MSIFLLDGQSHDTDGRQQLLPDLVVVHVWDHVFGNMIIKHPAMDRFPHDGYGDLQMYDMIGAQRVMLMNDLPATIDPIVWCLDVPQVYGLARPIFSKQRWDLPRCW